MAVTSALTEQLRTALGADRVISDPVRTTAYAPDWTGRFAAVPDVVALPRNTTEVAAAARACFAEGVPMIPRGGGTGLVGGAMAAPGAVVLDLRGLDELSVDAEARLIQVGAGVTLDQVRKAAVGGGLAYAVDLASRSSATVGGMIATNAGGLRALRYGDTRAQLAGIEAALADGTVLSHLPAVTRDNTGYHLPSLFCGSEGTLAVITRAALRLIPPPPPVTVAMLGFNSSEATVTAATTLAKTASVSAIELITRAGVELVCQVTGLLGPFAMVPPYILVIELAAVPDPEVVVGSITGLTEIAVATDPAAARRLWRYRDAHTEAIATLGAAHKLDVTLPPRALGGFIDSIGEVVTKRYPDADTWLFGHAGDGNVHVNITGVPADEGGVDGLILAAVAQAGGSISTEHGIGRAKLPWLHLARSAEEIASFRRIKAALDPTSLLNRGVLLPASYES